MRFPNVAELYQRFFSSHHLSRPPASLRGQSVLNKLSNTIGDSQDGRPHKLRSSPLVVAIFDDDQGLFCSRLSERFRAMQLYYGLLQDHNPTFQGCLVLLQGLSLQLPGCLVLLQGADPHSTPKQHGCQKQIENDEDKNPPSPHPQLMPENFLIRVHSYLHFKCLPHRTTLCRQKSYFLRFCLCFRMASIQSITIGRMREKTTTLTIKKTVGSIPPPFPPRWF